MSIKQVIIIRKDLKMRRGKECSQAAHASMKWLAERVSDSDIEEIHEDDIETRRVNFGKEEVEWLEGKFTKITCQVNSLDELLEIQLAAKAAKIDNVHIIVDSGATEFNGVPTSTCLALGPDLAEKIDAVTGVLDLY